jgi:hypothetical protein
MCSTLADVCAKLKKLHFIIQTQGTTNLPRKTLDTLYVSCPYLHEVTIQSNTSATVYARQNDQLELK